VDLFWTIRLLQVVVLGSMVVVGGTYLYRLLRYRSGLGGRFGAEVRSFMGRVSPSAYHVFDTRVDVHALAPRDPAAGPHVGLHVVARNWGRRVAFVTLTRTEACDLAGLLFRAAEQPACGRVGVIPTRGGRLERTLLEVQTLDPVNPIAGPHIALRVLASVLTGVWTRAPLALTRTEARELAELLVRAADERGFETTA
jgi:hypothetical protein